MRRKRWIVISATAVALVFGVGGGVAMAQEHERGGESKGRALVSRVAAILGLDEQQVQDAFVQARQEMHDEAIESRLEALVASGRMTQEQADAYKEWNESRPPSLGPGFGGRGFGGHGFRRGRGGGGPKLHRFRRGGPGPGGTPEADPVPGETSL